MGLLDEIKRLARPYEDEYEDSYDEDFVFIGKSGFTIGIFPYQQTVARNEHGIMDVYAVHDQQF